MDLSTGKRTRLIRHVSTDCNQLGVAQLDGDTAIGILDHGLERSGVCRGWADIFSLSAKSHRLRLLTSGHHAYEVAASGPFVSWLAYNRALDTGPNGGRIMLMDLRTGKQSVISRALPGTPAYCRVGPGDTFDRCATWLGMTRRLVYWASGAGPEVAYDISRRQSYRLPLTMGDPPVPVTRFDSGACMGRRSMSGQRRRPVRQA